MLLNILIRDPLILGTAADNNQNQFMFLEIQLPFLSGYDFKLTFLGVEGRNMRSLLFGLCSSMVVLKIICKRRFSFLFFVSLIPASCYEGKQNVFF